MSPPDSVGSATNATGNRESPKDFTEEKQEPVESLGEALAGVNLNNSSTGSFAQSSVPSDPFSLAPGTAQNDNDGWGNFADVTQTSFQKASSQDGKTAGTEQHMRNESLELFLSLSPSQTLGEDVFKLSHPNLPALAKEEEARTTGDASTAFRLSGQTLAPGPSNTPKTNFGEIRPDARRESPSASVTGTTASSRSVSPYTNSSDNRTIQAYQRYDSAPAAVEAVPRKQQSFAEDDRSASGYSSLNHGHGSNPSLATLDSGRSPFATKDRIHTKPVGSPFESFDRSSGFSQQPYAEAPQPQLAQQPQVLYMMVPSPDGRGQVLQPVEMVQLPGKAYSYVVPGAAGIQSGDGSQQPMMVLPPLPNQTGAEYSGALAGMDARTPSDSRTGNLYAVDTSRQYGGDNVSVGRDDYSRTSNGSGAGQYQATDASVSSLYSAPQRPPLESLLGQVRRLSRDQVGCRLVQQALDEEGPMAATLILNEGLPFWGEAMVDPFGNYLFQKILEKVTPEERVMLVKSVSTRLVNASLNLHGTRSVQKVVELCAIDEQNGAPKDGGESAADILTKSLTPAAARLCIDSHGNHVIQRILLKLGHEHSKFVFDAVAASVGDVARHRHGCCVIQRCLDSPPSEARAHLVRRIVEKSLELMQDAYGNYVVQYVLDVCSDSDVHAVCESVVGKVNLLAIQKFSSNVMEKCLERCDDRVKALYMQEMSDPERIRELMMDPFGNYVVQRALSVATHAQAIQLVEAMRPHLIATQTGGPNGQRNGGVRNTAGGRRIIAKICRRFPNFTLTPVGSQEELYSQNKSQHHAHRHHQAPGMPAYAPVGAPVHAHQPYADPRLQQGHMPIQQQQQQPYYNIGGGATYDHFSNGYGGYSGM